MQNDYWWVGNQKNKMRFILPNPNEYQHDFLAFIKQMELTLHHARKSFQSETEGLTDEQIENYFFIFRFPKINLYDREQDKEGFVKIHVDEEGEEMQNIEIEFSN